MHKFLLAVCALAASLFTLSAAQPRMLDTAAGDDDSSAEEEVTPAVTINLFDKAVFYDGYNGTVFDADLNDGILRHRNSLYAVRLSDEQIAQIGSTLTLDITIGALCDNYDRIGNINLALVPKGAETYDYQTVDRIELCRFITPFMNKNKEPREVPYSFRTDYLSYLFHDANLRAQYDMWVEFELFGIPYAANEQIAGCAGCNDVFEGTLNFLTDEVPAADNTDNVLVPIVMKKPEYIGGNLNNYSEAGTDTLGLTTKTYTFYLPEDVNDGQLVYIISNHGANSGGEEYIRRLHLVYFDGELVASYTPGGVPCEPYRVYNTQANGIYGSKRTDYFWQTRSNWCPGAAIPIRYIEFDAVAAGEHKVMIRVPDAVFKSAQGDFPTSIYFQGLKTGTLPSGIDRVVINPDVEAPTIDRQGDILNISATVPLLSVKLIDPAGRTVYDSTTRLSTVDLAPFPAGLYILCLYQADGTISTLKVVR